MMYEYREKLGKFADNSHWGCSVIPIARNGRRFLCRVYVVGVDKIPLHDFTLSGNSMHS